LVNPFEKRATEYLRDDEAFLAVVTPEPLETFFRDPAKEDRLYDRLVLVVGTPGSGKTTLARLFQYQTIRALLRNRSIDSHRPLVDALTTCGAISDGQPIVLGARLSLESEYREVWDFPYTSELKTGLMTALLQSRAVLGWIRNLQAAGVSVEEIEIVPRPGAEAATYAIGGATGAGLLARAREVELGIYRVAAALVAPPVDQIDQAALDGYRPFDVIESFRLRTNDQIALLRPLIIFDDAHRLHPEQLSSLVHWLVRRELRVSRWILTRLDALAPADVLLDRAIEAVEPGVQRTREITEIWMQSDKQRARQRRAFRTMSKDMANRYLGQMDVFSRRGLRSLPDLLSTSPVSLSTSKSDAVASHANAVQKRVGMSTERRRSLETDVVSYLSARGENATDLRLATTTVLMERYGKRTPQRGLFDDDIEIEPNRPLKADSGVVDGAQIHLLHRHGRPYYFGIDAVCDASSENAEQFLQLTGRLVSQAETQLIRGKEATLSSAVQHKLLRDRATEMIAEWDFPQFQLVRRLADGIASQCLERSLEGNASLGGGANAFGIPQSEFDSIPNDFPELARVLQFGVAYNAFALVRNHGGKGELWCLVELSGVLLLHHGLTLKRGGYLERGVEDLSALLTAL